MPNLRNSTMPSALRVLARWIAAGHPVSPAATRASRAVVFKKRAPVARSRRAYE
jgi:hypothetical protein